MFVCLCCVFSDVFQYCVLSVVLLVLCGGVVFLCCFSVVYSRCELVLCLVLRSECVCCFVF